jgi:hypothetical protein
MRNMMAIKNLLLTVIFLCSSFFFSIKAQDSSRIYFTSSVGIFLPVSKFAAAYKNSLALNSGIEYKINRHYFTQLVLDFNAVKYDQQFKDNNSDYLFQRTNSSVFLAGINIGRNIIFKQPGNFFVSPYVGIGYANIGEPRLTVNNNTGIIQQQVIRMKGIFIRQGLRIVYKTKSKILQTIYLDPSCWTADINVQQSRAKSFLLLAGTRIAF